jgi:Tfp pilus assembly protein PilN
MINLLPSENKRELIAARTNTLLVRYNVFMIGAVVFLFIAIGVVYVYLGNAKATAEKTIAENQSKVIGFKDVEEQATEFRQNLTIAKQILDREVNYTHVILRIAKLLPSGTVLSGLSLDSATFGTQTTLVAKAKSYEQAIALKDSFSKSDLFSDVHFQSITTTEGASAYPLTVTLNVTFKKEAAKS